MTTPTKPKRVAINDEPTAYLAGYEAAKRRQLESTNPYDVKGRQATCHAYWLQGWDDYRLGVKAKPPEPV